MFQENSGWKSKMPLVKRRQAERKRKPKRELSWLKLSVPGSSMRDLFTGVRLGSMRSVLTLSVWCTTLSPPNILLGWLMAKNEKKKKVNTFFFLEEWELFLVLVWLNLQTEVRLRFFLKVKHFSTHLIKAIRHQITSAATSRKTHVNMRLIKNKNSLIL